MIEQTTINEYQKLKPKYKPAYLAAYLSSFINNNVCNMDSTYIEELLDLIQMILTDYYSDNNTPEMSDFEREIIKVMRERE